MFKLTTTAKDAIVQQLGNGNELIPMVTWVTDSTQKNGKWELGGFIDKADPNVEELRRQKGAKFFFEISGIEFVIDGPMHYLDLLKEATLDYENGTFVFNS